MFLTRTQSDGGDAVETHQRTIGAGILVAAVLLVLVMSFTVRGNTVSRSGGVGAGAPPVGIPVLDTGR